MSKIGFLGVIIGSNRIKMEKEKVDGVLSWPELKNIKDVRKFLGLANYYRRFIIDEKGYKVIVGVEAITSI